jgi:DNA-binding response OmpR family regulator
MRVLVIEDEEVLAERIAFGLRHQGLAVDVAYDGEGGLEKVYANPYDVVVLDRDLPRMHGDHVCREIVSDPGLTTRILMLTASAGIEQRVEGLTIGADDYLPKPFHFSELLARIRSLGRRAPSLPPVLRHGDLEVDPVRSTVTRAGLPISLRRKEFALLVRLLQADGQPVSAERLLDHAWDDRTNPTTTTVRMTISRLRQKLGDPPLIETVVGVGYRI